MSTPMARKSPGNPGPEDPYVDRPIPDPRPITPFPTKVPVPQEIPWVKDLPLLMIDVSVMDRTALWLHDRIRYAKWAVFLLRVTVKAIKIIQSVYSDKEQSNG